MLFLDKKLMDFIKTLQQVMKLLHQDLNKAIKSPMRQNKKNPCWGNVLIRNGCWCGVASFNSLEFPSP